MHPGHPSPMLSFASHQHSANARFGLWDAWQAVLSALTWPNVGMRFEVSTLSGAPIFQRPNVQGALTIVKAKKTEKRSSSQDTHARAVGSAAALAIDADDATSVARLCEFDFCNINSLKLWRWGLRRFGSVGIWRERRDRARRRGR